MTANYTPDHTAVRVAMWRALHHQVDAPPYVIEDEVGLKLVTSDDEWRKRPDMDVQGTIRFRASIIARARFVEDQVAELNAKQYVILGSGLDTFAQRKPDVASKMQVFEVDRPALLEWKKERLIQLGYDLPKWLHFAPVDFEKASWKKQLIASGFDMKKPAVISSTGVVMYLSKEAITETLHEIATFAPGSTLIMSFLQPLHLIEPEMRPVLEATMQRAKAAGTPFVSFFSPQEIQELALSAGFKKTRHVSAAELTQLYFKGRKDGLRPSNGEEIMVATV